MSQWEVTKVAMKNITIQSAVDEEEHGTVLLEVAQFLKLYDLVNARCWRRLRVPLPCACTSSPIGQALSPAQSF